MGFRRSVFFGLGAGGLDFFGAEVWVQNLIGFFACLGCGQFGLLVACVGFGFGRGLGFGLCRVVWGCGMYRLLVRLPGV